MPLKSSKQVLEAAGASGVPQTSVCRILQGVAVKQKQLQWAQKYMRTNFETVLFTDECRATLDGLDGWSSGWLVYGHHVPTMLQCQQGGRGVMLWAGIMGRELVGPFSCPWRCENDLRKVSRVSDCPLSSVVNKEEPCYLLQNHLHAWQCIVSSCKEYLCITGCYGHKKRDTHCVASILPWPQPYWEPLQHPQAKGLWGREAVHIQTAALGGYSDILWRNSSRNSPKTHKFNGCKNCEAVLCENVTLPVEMFLIEIAFNSVNIPS